MSFCIHVNLSTVLDNLILFMIPVPAVILKNTLNCLAFVFLLPRIIFRNAWMNSCSIDIKKKVFWPIARQDNKLVQLTL